jgi:hypothetical protein
LFKRAKVPWPEIIEKYSLSPPLGGGMVAESGAVPELVTVKVICAVPGSDGRLILPNDKVRGPTTSWLDAASAFEIANITAATTNNVNTYLASRDVRSKPRADVIGAKFFAQCASEESVDVLRRLRPSAITRCLRPR